MDETTVTDTQETTPTPEPIVEATVTPVVPAITADEIRNYWRMYTTDTVAQSALGCRFQAENEHHLVLAWLFSAWTVVLLPVAAGYHFWWLRKKRKTMIAYREYLNQNPRE